jgi:hypothetical protein
LTGFRCSNASLDRSDPLHGTASTVRAFLLIECAGPWGVVALRDCRIPREVTGPLQRLSRTLGIRPLLIRRHRRQASGGARIFAAYADPQRPWMESAQLDDVTQLLDLDLAPLARGATVGMTPTQEPLFLVCTHGKHDACCAEKGRPVAAALTEVEPEATWEVSHIGGDRFAGNVLVLRDGLCYGRVDAVSAVALAAGHRAGRLDIGHLRGRSGYPFAVQAAEWFLRQELHAEGLRDLRLLARRTDGDFAEADFRVHGQSSWRVRVRRSHSVPQRLTCSAIVDSPIPRFDLTALEELGAA